MTITFGSVPCVCLPKYGCVLSGVPRLTNNISPRYSNLTTFFDHIVQVPQLRVFATIFHPSIRICRHRVGNILFRQHDAWNQFAAPCSHRKARALIQKPMLAGWLCVANHGSPAEHCSFHTGFVQSAARRGLGFHIEWALDAC
jgi:hypothetical protein